MVGMNDVSYPKNNRLNIEMFVERFMTTMMANNDNCISQLQIAKRKLFFHEKNVEHSPSAEITFLNW